MTIDHAIAPGQLMSEIAEIDVLLMQYEDWRALLQLESREKQGDAVRSINSDTLKALLLESLSVNPLFARRQHLLAELEKIARDLQRLGTRIETQEAAPVSGETPKPAHDDLTQIVGIDARLAKRLNILNVRTLSQIANWTPDDVEYVSNTLGLGQHIVSQDWIRQAAQLVPSRIDAAPESDAWVHARSGAATVAPPPAQIPAPSPVALVAADPKPAQPVAKSETTAEPVAPPAVAAVAAVPAQPSVVPDAKSKSPTPAPSAHVEKQAPPAAAVPGTLTTEVDQSWKKFVPAFPLAARSYKAENLPDVPLQPVKSQLPTMPLAARNYSGGVLEPKHDGAVYGSLVPAKPLPALAYRVTAAETPSSPAAPQVAANVAEPHGGNTKAADILQHTLPPLPLRPSAPSAPISAPPPMPQAQPPVQLQAKTPGPVQPSAATAQSEALLLAVVAARSAIVAGASPPPLPADAKNGTAPAAGHRVQSPPPPPVTRQAPINATVAQMPMANDVEPVISRQGSVEARVTIKRSEEALSNTVLRTPGGTDVHLGSRRGSPSDDFDGTSYAAYRGSIEEASVQIVRRPPATKTPDVPPPLTTALANAAQAAAQNAAQVAIQAGQASQPMAGLPVEAVAPAGKTMGRFLKALTGQ